MNVKYYMALETLQDGPRKWPLNSIQCIAYIHVQL